MGRGANINGAVIFSSLVLYSPDSEAQRMSLGRQFSLVYWRNGKTILVSVLAKREDNSR